MPAHTNAWNNASPVGSDLASSIDDFMRAMKLDIDERMSLQHYWGDATAVGVTQDGTHRAIEVNPAADVSVLKTNTNQSVTGSGVTPAVDLGITWNTTGVVTAIKANITNTASGANSKLIDLQIGGSTVFSVDKDGDVVITGGLTVPLLTNPTIANATFYKAKNSGGTAASILGIDGTDKLIIGTNAADINLVEFQARTGFVWDVNGTDFWAIDGSGHYHPSTDVVTDIGNATHRVRRVFTDGIYSDGFSFSNLSGVAKFGFNVAAGGQFSVVAGAVGAGAAGGAVLLQHNTSGGGAPGNLRLAAKNGTIYNLWVDTTGDLRISTTQPTESTGDVIGSVVGLQL
jgi:hypothetical protein